MLSDAIISMIIVSVSGLLALLFKLCYSSKCKTVKLCCLDINRDTEHEVNINMNQTPNQN
jgi:hypothetical protein